MLLAELNATVEESGMSTGISRVKAHLVLEGREESIRNWPVGHLCYTQKNNLSTFCLCSRNFNEVSLKMVS